MRKGCEAFILLSDTGNAKETIADLPSNGDVLAVIWVSSAENDTISSDIPADLPPTEFHTI